MFHVSSLVVSPAFHHEHFIFLIHSSFYDKRTHCTIGTTRATPRTPGTSRTSPSSLRWRHQESLWREDLQCGGNPRTTTPTGYDPKELATVSRIEAYSGDPYQLYDVHEKVGEEDHRAPITEEVDDFGEIGTAGLRDSGISETSYFQSQMHFDDSVESIADSALEDGELQKMRTSPLYVLKASEKPDAMVMQEREVSVTARAALEKDTEMCSRTERL